MAEFVHLRMYSEYSIRDGGCRIVGGEGAAARAATLQMPALAITDTGNIFGALKFYEESRKRGVQAIIGAEAETANNGNLLMLCASNEGYANLSKLLTAAYRDGGGKIPAAILNKESAEGIIALSGARRGSVGNFIARGDGERAAEEANELAAVFPGRFYLELWRAIDADNHLCAQTAKLARQMNIPAVAAHPVQCASESDMEMLQARRCVAHNWKLGQEEQPALADEPWLLPPEEMRRRFADIPGAADNAVEIARRCNFAFNIGKTHLPRIDDSGESACEQLARVANEGLQLRLQNIKADAEKYQERLDEELRVIKETGFDDYFLIVADFVRWAKQNNVPVGPGRGSGAGSLVAFALDITTLDPMEHGLFFERFLNKARVSPPDFDIDFCARGRDKVIQYVTNKYGEGRVSQIVTFGAFGARGGVRDIGRILGHGYGFGDKLARMISPTPDITLEDAMKESEKLRAEIKENDEAKRIVALAQKVEGTPRSIGTHAGGVLIAPKPIPEFCPLYTADDGGALVSQFDMTDIEKTGLLKFDFLGLRTLTIIDHAEKHLRASGVAREDFTMDEVRLDDDKVYDLYSAGKTMGVFQCESGGMRQLMRNLRPHRFEEITALVALYRPGPLGAGMAERFVARKNGKEDIDYPHPSTESTLKETYGVIIYQEQVMQIARLVAGYSLSEADLLRRAIGKKNSAEAEKQRARFLDGAKKNMPAREAEALFEQVLSFAGYGFNKAHAAAYALLSYRTAYLKVHHTAAFYAAAMSVEADSTDRMKMYVREAKQDGIAILPPDINKSARDFFAVDAKTVRYGLGAVRGLGGAAIDDIERARGDKPFADIFDLCERAASGKHITQAAIRNIVCAGALDELHADRAAAAAALPSAWSGGGEQSAMLFGKKVMRKVEGGKPWTTREKLTEENQALGFCLSESFYSLHAGQLSELAPRLAKTGDIVEGAVVLIAGVVTGIKTSGLMRSKGFEMLMLEDDSGEISVRAGNREMKSIGDAPKKHDLLVVEGEAREFSGNIELNARRLWTLDSYLAARARRLRLYCNNNAENGAREFLRVFNDNAVRIKGDNGNGCEVLVSCNNGGGEPYQISLGRYRVNAALCESLRAAAAVERIRVECAGESR